MEQERCARCNRPLRNMRSVERGLGYVCYRKLRKEKADREFERMQTNIYDFLPKEEDPIDNIRESKYLLFWSDQNSQDSRGSK